MAPSVFISYSHDSPDHADRVLALADRLRAEGVDAILDQYEPAPPEGWPRWMDRRIRDADFVLMVCTETYLRRVMGEEAPGKGLGVKWEGNLIYNHIYNADSLNRKFIPVLFEDGLVEHIPMPLWGVTRYWIDTPEGYENLYRHLTNQPRIIKPTLSKLRALLPLERKPDFLDIKISTAKLPSTDSYLVGREKELVALDMALESPKPERSVPTQKTNVLTLIAFGGVGKTALVNKWLTQLAQDNYRGVERVYGWSFYSQGAAEGRQVAADAFIAAALTWFGDPDPTAGSPWDKGERLAELIKQERTLLILDGLETLQNPPPVEPGRIKDPALRSLLRELARHNPGLVVITTRLVVDDLKDFLGTSAIEIDLSNLSPKAGMSFLKHLKVNGTDEELMRADDEYRGHALALTLLGTYLATVHRGDIRQRDKIARLTDERKQGAHARRVMATYEGWLKDKPELDILRLMGLFDRPAERGALEALRKEPAIEGLTQRVQKLSHADFQYAVKNLRDLRLLTDEDPHDPDALDCHPLLREHFGEQLPASNPNAWREAHSRLYEYYKSTAKEFPDTLEEMAPLFAAVGHGCQAGRHQEALDDVYRPRIQRGQEYFNWKKLGAFGASLATLSSLFDSLWYRPMTTLNEESKGFVLNQAGLYLRALGRLAESAQAMSASLEAWIAQGNWKYAAIDAGNLSELYLTLGDIARALNYSKQGVELVDQSGDSVWRIHARVRLADALHQAGVLSESETAFLEAEEMQKSPGSQFLLLYSLSGFQYCDLLLSQGKYLEVQSHAHQTLEWAKERKLSLLTIALDNLSLGRAYLMQAQSDGSSDYSQALVYLGYAVDGLRQSGQQDDLPRGLLARAELHRVMGALEKARRDLDEAYSIATRGGMRLHEADCHLEYARLFVASGEKDNAQEHLAIAKKMIEEMGYRRREAEVVECQRILSGSADG